MDSRPTGNQSATARTSRPAPHRSWQTWSRSARSIRRFAPPTLPCVTEDSLDEHRTRRSLTRCFYPAERRCFAKGRLAITRLRVAASRKKRKRGEQDSNLRIRFRITDLANRRFRPLSHLPRCFVIYNIAGARERSSQHRKFMVPATPITDPLPPETQEAMAASRSSASCVPA